MNYLLLCAAAGLLVCAPQTPSTILAERHDEKCSLLSFNKKEANDNAGNDPFVRTNSFKERVVVRDPIGYLIYDMSVYQADFTDRSYLYLCELRVDFTPGSVASKNESGFDWHYDFWAADVSLSVSKNLSSEKVMDFWPKSSSVVTTLTSEYGQEYTLGLTGTVGLGGGASIGGSASGGFTITHSVSTSSEDPTISAQLLSENLDTAVWNIQCLVQRGLTYNFACYLLIEVPKDSLSSFSFSSSVDMTCVAWRRYLWEQRKHVYANDSLPAF